MDSGKFEKSRLKNRSKKQYWKSHFLTFESEISLHLHRGQVAEEKTEHVRQTSVLQFMKNQLESVKIRGYREVYELLVSLEQNSHDKNETSQFVAYMATLEFHDIVEVWKSFSLYAVDTIIKRELSSLIEKTEDGSGLGKTIWKLSSNITEKSSHKSVFRSSTVLVSYNVVSFHLFRIQQSWCSFPQSSQAFSLL